MQRKIKKLKNLIFIVICLILFSCSKNTTIEKDVIIDETTESEEETTEIIIEEKAMLVNTTDFRPNEDDFFGMEKDERPIYSVKAEAGDKQRYKKIAMTFDSGNSLDQTIKLLDVLDLYNVKCTFFLTFDSMRQGPELVKEIVNRGHEVANHSTTHPHFKELTREQIYEELKVPHEFVKNLCGVEMNLFRFPYGSYDDESVKAVKEFGYYPIQWSNDSIDWKNEGVEPIVLRICDDEKLYSGAILLFHNGPKYTVDALPVVINYIRDKGFEFVKVSDIIYPHDFEIRIATGKQYKKGESR